jgi:hypothetical protein
LIENILRLDKTENMPGISRLCGSAGGHIRAKVDACKSSPVMLLRVLDQHSSFIFVPILPEAVMTSPVDVGSSPKVPGCSDNRSECVQWRCEMRS